jgi:hypothetical protein
MHRALRRPVFCAILFCAQLLCPVLLCVVGLVLSEPHLLAAQQAATPSATLSATPPAQTAQGAAADAGTPPSTPATTPTNMAGSGASPAAPPFITRPIAIVPLDSKIEGAASLVTGALQVWNGRAYIATNGSITAGANTAQVTLPYRGTLHICASTTVKLAADSNVAAGQTPGLLMAIDHGALETSFATGRNADVIMTPDFRILIGGPGPSELKVRLGKDGDTCVDNPGTDAPYVVVTSPFDSGLYRVQPGQRVMFQHGSLREVVDQETEPCGCPAAPVHPVVNEFPLAQSEGLAATPAPKAAPTQPGGLSPQATEPLVYLGGDQAGQTAKPPEQTAAAPQPPAAEQSAPSASATAKPASVKEKKPGFFRRIGHFFRRLFGAE